MYMHYDEIDQGLKEEQTWPTVIHRKFAQSIALYNKNVLTEEALTEVVQTVITMTRKDITNLSIGDLIKKKPNMERYFVIRRKKNAI